ncbi:DUF3006 domain-containing protein [Evansella clarkii]|jgi:hypothetical protein|uniref:DUF3006 domain-containing protein n=1 Tax=Evansella clarkii TaxID=79879 RepID=UPI0009979F4B|nr:DUF3006 domain-containing protein [Evansella clarkii]
MADYEKAVIDRVEEGKQAVLLVGEEEKELVVGINSFPFSIKEGDHLLVRLSEGKFISAEKDEASENVSSARIKSKMEKLRQKKSSKYKN